MKRLLLLVLVLCLIPGVASAKEVGIWFEVLHSKEKNYNWATGFGGGTSARYTADVNGDGKDDALTFVASNGNWYVALSNGSTFDTYTQWVSGIGIGSTNRFVADVTGDGKADLITFFVSNGDWWVTPSTGSSFSSPVKWSGGNGVNSTNQLIGDVTGDGKADAVVYLDVSGAQGNWYISTSTGINFNDYTLWKSGHGHGSQRQFISDTTGDGKGDAVVYFDITTAQGKWYNATSTGSGFNNYSEWSVGFGHGSNAQLMGDITGDGKSDAIVYFQNGNTIYDPSGSAWYKGVSDGSRFVVEGVPWQVTHGNNVHHNQVGPADNVFLADVDGNSKDESIAYHNSLGQWKVLFDGYQQPAYMNYWEALSIEHKPIVNGVTGFYDSNDPAVIDWQLNEIDNAGIDFILIDLTNGVTSHDFIFNRAKTTCARIANHNANGGSLKYAIAAGKVQYTSNVADVEAEAQEVLDKFVNDSICGPSYYKVNNVPLLENHFANTAQKNAWLASSRTASNNFVVKYGQGRLPEAPSNVPSSTGQGCGTISSPSPTLVDIPNYLGWSLPYGTIANGSYAAVMPGTDNKSGNVIKRTQNGSEAGFYRGCGWDRIQDNKTSIDTVVIASYNDYAEATAVAPTNTSGVTGSSEQWSSPDLYWNITKDQVANFKGVCEE